MAPRKTPKSKIRLVQGVELQPGDPVWAYLRHSPGEDQTIESQRQAVERFVAEQQLVVLRWFVDEARSGSRVEGRGEFEDMLLASRQQPPAVKAIIVWDLSRFSRDDLESQFYSADLRLRGYEIVSIHDDIPRGEFAPIFEAFIRWKNSRYLRDLQAATIRGLDAVVNDRHMIDGEERTGFSAGGFPPRGYEARTVEVGTKPSGKPLTRTYWVKTEDADLRERIAAAWRLAIEASREGLRPPYYEIHQRCRIHGDTTSYYDMFRTITYAGVRKVGDRLVEKAHEAFVTREEFELVQAALDRSQGLRGLMHYKRNGSPFALSGRVFCGYCGAPVNYDPDRRREDTAYLRCSRRKNGAEKCQLRKLTYRTFMESLTEAIREQVLTEENIGRILDELERTEGASKAELAERRIHLARKLEGVERSIERLLDLLESGDGAASVRARLAEREREKERIGAEMEEVTRALRRLKPKRIDLNCGARLASGVGSMISPAMDPELLRSIVARAELENEGGKIHWTLPSAWLSGYPVGDSNARTWLRRPALYPLS